MFFQDQFFSHEAQLIRETRGDEEEQMLKYKARNDHFGFCFGVFWGVGGVGFLVGWLWVFLSKEEQECSVGEEQAYINSLGFSLRKQRAILSFLLCI